MNSNQFRHILPKSYYLNIDVVHLAKDLLGKVIYTKINHKITSGIIIETEAYKSINDLIYKNASGIFHVSSKKSYNRKDMLNIFLTKYLQKYE